MNQAHIARSLLTTCPFINIMCYYVDCKRRLTAGDGLNCGRGCQPERARPVCRRPLLELFVCMPGMPRSLLGGFVWRVWATLGGSAEGSDQLARGHLGSGGEPLSSGLPDEPCAPNAAPPGGTATGRDGTGRDASPSYKLGHELRPVPSAASVGGVVCPTIPGCRHVSGGVARLRRVCRGGDTVTRRVTVSSVSSEHGKGVTWRGGALSLEMTTRHDIIGKATVGFSHRTHVS